MTNLNDGASHLWRRQLDGGADISLEELCLVIETSHDLLAITGFDGHFQLLSPSWETALGYTRDELRAKPFIEFVHPADRDKTDVVSARIRPGVELLSFSNRYIHKDGSIRHLNWKGIVSAEAERYYTSTVETSADLRRNETADALDALCELYPGAVLMADMEGLLTRCDGEAEGMFGWRAAQLAGTPAGHLLRDEQGEPMDLVKLAGEEVDGVTGTARKTDGQWVTVEVALRSFGNGSVSMTGVVATVVPTGV